MQQVSLRFSVYLKGLQIKNSTFKLTCVLEKLEMHAAIKDEKTRKGLKT
jgi:hypothetical protein